MLPVLTKVNTSNKTIPHPTRRVKLPFNAGLPEDPIALLAEREPLLLPLVPGLGH
jgi:hypothetical protein